MITDAGAYLDVATVEKGLIRMTSWNCFGLIFISNQTRIVMYFALAALAVIFGV